MYFVLLFLWIVFNGQFTLEILLIGAVIAALLYWFVCKYMDYHYEKDIYICKKAGKLLVYFFVLLREILKANAATLKKVLSSKHKPEPAIVTFTVDLKTDVGRVMLANSITLTPGTITIGMDGNRYVVHCLDKSFGEGMESSVFVKRIQELEKEYPAYLAKLEAKAKKKAERKGQVSHE